METKIIDLKGRNLGRMASKIALLLQGKKTANFQPNIVQPIKIKAINASKLQILDKKMKQKRYHRYSGYPGGFKIKKMEDIFIKNPAEIFKKAVFGMLPKNKLRAKMIKNLIIKNEI